jgi:hypothetical protein
MIFLFLPSWPEFLEFFSLQNPTPLRGFGEKKEPFFLSISLGLKIVVLAETSNQNLAKILRIFFSKKPHTLSKNNFAFFDQLCS